MRKSLGLVGGGVVMMLALALPAQALMEVDGFQFFFQNMGQFDVPSVLGVSRVVPDAGPQTGSADLKVEGVWDEYYVEWPVYDPFGLSGGSVPATFAMTAADMIQDQTGMAGKPQALFADNSGGAATTITVYGKLTGPGGDLFTGTLLTAEVSGDFLAKRVETWPSFTTLDIHQNVVVTGGELSYDWQTGMTLDGQAKVTDLYMLPQFEATYTFYQCTQNNGPVVNFQSVIDYPGTNGSIVHFSNFVPEPVSVTLLAAGLVGWRLRRRRQ